MNFSIQTRFLRVPFLSGQSKSSLAARWITITLAATFVASPVAPAPYMDGEWVTVTDHSLEIEAGSPLDFSSIAPRLPDSRMTISGEKLTFRGVSLPLNCATLAPGFSDTAGSGFPDHQTAQRYAEQLVRHGYNIVRFHFIDALLMREGKADFAFNPEELDRFQFFVSELKKRGVHWVTDILSSQNAALGNVFPHRWSENRGMLKRIFFEPAALNHWQELAHQILNTRNPYTGTTLAQDSHTAALVLVNEPDLDFQMELENNFKDKPIPSFYKDAYLRGTSVANQTNRIPFTSQENGESMEKFQRFLVKRQIDVLANMSNTIRRLGYDGAYTSFNAWKRYNETPIKRLLPIVDSHNYEHDQVALGIGPGVTMRSSSSFSDLGRYLTLASSTRQFGKPFIVTEHDQEFWNSRRFEAGLFSPTLASIQGWNFICRHADGPIDLAYDGQGVRKSAINPAGTGLDPVARAGETLTALLLLRREIAPAQGAVRLQLSDDEALRDGGRRQLPNDLSPLAWVARLGLVNDRRSAPAVGVDQSLASDPDHDSMPPEISSRTSSLLGKLRLVGAVPKGNQTDPAIGQWQSPSRQVLLRAKNNELQVSTQFTSARAGNPIVQPVTIGPVRYIQSDSPALVALSALDGRPLAESGRILVILSADARNSGMQVTPAGTLTVLGNLPIQIRRVRMKVILKTGDNHQWTISSLSLGGKIKKVKKLDNVVGNVNVDLDSALVPESPTTYFLLSKLPS
ncbi:hypothetical protein EWE75_21455 [Sphingomonas populi]|uniref:Glycoside hydrolase family 5 domain-containing protein n=1 Tax=Sphingomonas populi TaxID=2484750 RepID=A0A4Q6XV34_9SPHN|nr:hypothetical protein [Sphingomonas populi]RZF60739.1 hypothetical protein EWE75_21455 [Sphingomonas populi]